MNVVKTWDDGIQHAVLRPYCFELKEEGGEGNRKKKGGGGREKERDGEMDD